MQFGTKDIHLNRANNDDKNLLKEDKKKYWINLRNLSWFFFYFLEGCFGPFSCKIVTFKIQNISPFYFKLYFGSGLALKIRINLNPADSSYLWSEF